MGSPGSLFPGWYWVRLVTQEHTWCMEGGIKHHSLFSGGLLRVRGVTVFHSLGGWSDGSLWAQKGGQMGSSSKVTLPCILPLLCVLCEGHLQVPGEATGFFSRGPAATPSLDGATDGRGFRTVLRARGLSWWAPACPQGSSGPSRLQLGPRSSGGPSLCLCCIQLPSWLTVTSCPKPHAHLC